MSPTPSHTGTATFATRTRRDVVRVSGPDAASYLQGQLSQDLDALAVGTSTWTFVLQPQGKVDGWARITKTAADGFCLDTDPGAGEALRARLERFLLRTKADIESFTEPSVVVRGPGAPRDSHLPDGVLRLPVAGPAVEGYDLLGDDHVPAGLVEAGAERYDAYRVEHGVPEVGRELDADTIPAEVGQWIVDSSVSFTKGCFVGQELVARIDSRGGNVPRQLRAIVLDEPVEPGTGVEADGPAGPVTTSAISDVHGPVALAFCGRRVEPGSSVSVGGVAGTVRALPLGDEESQSDPER
jgi:tRNA-modifying protein YgfZ